MNFLKNLSLRAKIIGFNLACLLLLGSVIYFLFHRSTDTNIANLEKSYYSYAESLQASISAQFFERYGDVQAFALNPDIKSNDHNTIVTTLNNYVSMYGIYDVILVVDSKGNLVATNDKDASGKEINSRSLYKKNYAQEKWFQETFKGNFLEDKEKNYTGTYFEDPSVDPYVSEVYGESKWGNGFSAQIKNSKGEVIGVISNRANFKWVENELLNLADSLEHVFHATFELMTLNENGKVLAIYNSSEDKEKYVRKFDELGKTRIYDEHEELKNLDYSKSGVLEAYDNELKLTQIVAYSSFKDKKWPSAIHWSTMMHIDKEGAFASMYKSINEFYMVFAGFLVAICLLSLWFGSSLSKLFSRLSESLSNETKELLVNSASMATTSDQLSSAATEQAAALQETVSAIDEVSAMVSKNAENARKSKEISQESEKSALHGKKTMDEMIQVIDEIHRSNTEMMDQIKKSNEEFTNIVNVINEIGSKTKVINDIVFQTKLLSFNASVEAARAGAHGKGFAVVAEEVGNLAQMSGNAAKEITNLLEGSVTKVEAIVADTKSRVDKLVDIGKVKVEAGIKTAKSCSDVLEEIVASVSQVNQMVEEISTASNEQAQGVSEITKAMNQLDQVTQQNTSAATVSSDTALAVKNKAEVFNEVVVELTHVIRGGSEAQKPALDTKSTKSSKTVIPMSDYKKKKHAEPAEATMKKASGDDSTPSANDSRFEDV